MQGQRSNNLPGFRESALRASRAMVGAPLRAAGGRATTIKLQTNLEHYVFDRTLSSWSSARSAGRVISSSLSQHYLGIPPRSRSAVRAELHGLFPRGRGVRGAATASEWAPSPQRANTAREPRKFEDIFAANENSFNCRRDRSSDCRDNARTFFRGAASRPCGPPALWLGPPQRRGGLDKTIEWVEFESMSHFRIHPE